MEKQEILEEIKRLSGEVQRMTDGGYEKSTWNQNKNIASFYAELGNEEEAVKHYLKVLDVLKMEPIEERHSLYWYTDYFNTFSEMMSYSEFIPNLKYFDVECMCTHLENITANLQKKSTKEYFWVILQQQQISSIMIQRCTILKWQFMLNLMKE